MADWNAASEDIRFHAGCVVSIPTSLGASNDAAPIGLRDAPSGTQPQFSDAHAQCFILSPKRSPVVSKLQFFPAIENLTNLPIWSLVLLEVKTIQFRNLILRWC